MNKIYKKNEVTFAIILIVLYVVGTSVAESLSESLKIYKLVPAAFHIVLTILILCWIKKNGLEKKYGLIFPKYNLKQTWFFLPLIVVACLGLFGGVTVRYSGLETVLFVISMFCVGFLEEIIFRGFLFVGMAKKNISAATIVSSLTFGIGHIVNLLNGKNLTETLIQIVFAVVVGFTLVIIFFKGKSLLPCIIFHGLNNALSAFEKTNAEVVDMFSMSEVTFEITVISAIILILAIYNVFILKKTNLSEEKNGAEGNSNTGE